MVLSDGVHLPSHVKFRAVLLQTLSAKFRKLNNLRALKGRFRSEIRLTLIILIRLQFTKQTKAKAFLGRSILNVRVDSELAWI